MCASKDSSGFFILTHEVVAQAYKKLLLKVNLIIPTRNKEYTKLSMLKLNLSLEKPRVTCIERKA